MKCMVSYIQWYHEMYNGKELQCVANHFKTYPCFISGSVRLLRTGATKGTPYHYKVKNVTPQDSGFYSCVAGNVLGETVASAFLEVNAAQTAYVNTRLISLLLFIHVVVMNHIVMPSAL